MFYPASVVVRQVGAKNSDSEQDLGSCSRMGQYWAHVPHHSPVLVLLTLTQASSRTLGVPHSKGFMLNCPEKEPHALSSSDCRKEQWWHWPCTSPCGTGPLQSSRRQLWHRGCCWHRIDCQGWSLCLSSPFLQLISVFLFHLLPLIPVFSHLPRMFYSSVPVNSLLEGRVG